MGFFKLNLIVKMKSQKDIWTESNKLNPDAAEFSRFSHMPHAFISCY